MYLLILHLEQQFSSVAMDSGAKRNWGIISCFPGGTVNKLRQHHWCCDSLPVCRLMEGTDTLPSPFSSPREHARTWQTLSSSIGEWQTFENHWSRGSDLTPSSLCHKDCPCPQWSFAWGKVFHPYALQSNSCLTWGCFEDTNASSEFASNVD